MRKLRLNEFLPYRLSIAANAVSNVVAAAYEARFNLSVPEWRLIAVLHEHGSCTQQDLVRLTLMDKVAVSRAAIALDKRGLIERTQDSEDGRALRLRLSADGRELHRRITPAALKYEAQIFSCFNAREIAALQEMLVRLEEAAKQIGSNATLKAS